MKVLVTGGAGFIGSHIAEAYRDRGHQVTVLDDFSTGVPANVPDGVQLVELDICDPAAGKLIERERFDVINHHAGLISVPESFRIPVAYTTVNVVGTVNLLEAAVRSGVGQFIFVSTSVVYAEQERMPYREDDPTVPTSPYGVSKLAAEEFVNMYARQYPSLRTTILRYGNVFGPRQRVYGEGNLVAACATKLLSGDRPTIFGDGTHTRDYIYVGDIAELNCRLLEQPVTGTFNVGTGIERTVLEVYREVARAVGTDREPLFGPPRIEQARIVLSIERIQQALGWQPSVSFSEGIARTVAWFRTQITNASPRDEASTEHTLRCSSGAGDTAGVGNLQR